MTTVHLDNLSRYAQVNYFRCLECMHVWNIPKNGGAVQHVTVKPKPDEGEP